MESDLAVWQRIRCCLMADATTGWNVPSGDQHQGEYHLSAYLSPGLMQADRESKQRLFLKCCKLQW